MKADLEFVLEFQENRWTAQSGDLRACGESIEELDQNIKAAVGSSGKFPRGRRVAALLLCDARVIPDWMRPYHGHYFNRLIYIDL
jgi:hypothetical protein